MRFVYNSNEELMPLLLNLNDEWVRGKLNDIIQEIENYKA